MNNKEMILNCKIITPLFMGGARQEPELRTQSFNGLFRYWFRILGGSIEDERKIFGWGGEKANKGLLQLFINYLGKNKWRVGTFSKEVYDKNKYRRGSGLNYIGFSLDFPSEKYQSEKSSRNYIKENVTFPLILRFHPKSDYDDIRKALAAVWASFYLGNYGSRARRGFGSIIVEKVEKDTGLNFDIKFTPEGEICAWIVEELSKIKSINKWQAREEIPYVFENLEIYRINKNNINALSDWVKEVQSKRKGGFLANKWDPGKKSEKMYMLDYLGFLLMAFRSYHEADYMVAKRIIEGNKESRGNEKMQRIIFGLPMNFYFQSRKKKEEVMAKLNNKSLRRAFPLIFKIIEFGGNLEALIYIFKPNEKHKFRFLPNGAKIQFKNKILNLPDWELIENFIISLVSKNMIVKIY